MDTIEHLLPLFAVSERAPSPRCALAKAVAAGPANLDTVDALGFLQRAEDAAVRAAVP